MRELKAEGRERGGGEKKGYKLHQRNLLVGSVEYFYCSYLNSSVQR